MSITLFNGQPASTDDLRALALVNYGHFSSMQVRDHAVQGIGLHQQRLTAATRELFGNGSADGSWIASHAVLMAVVWPVVLSAIFFPLSVRRFQRLSR